MELSNALILASILGVVAACVAKFKGVRGKNLVLAFLIPFVIPLIVFILHVSHGDEITAENECERRFRRRCHTIEAADEAKACIDQVRQDCAAAN